MNCECHGLPVKRCPSRELPVVPWERNAYQKQRYAHMPRATCHPDRKEHAAGWCRSCYRTEGKRAKRASCHPDRLQVAKGLCRECYNDLPENKARAIRARRLRKYNLTESQYAALLEGQGWACVICGNAPTCVDHDHESGAVRGLLCRLCNAGLGLFKDDPALLRTAAHYLEGA